MGLFPAHFSKCVIKILLLLMQTKPLLLLLFYIKTHVNRLLKKRVFHCDAVTGNPMPLRITMVLVKYTSIRHGHG